MYGEGHVALSSVFKDLGYVVMAELTVQVGRENRMGGSAVDMSGFSMMKIRFWMHVDQGNGEHPNRHPYQDHRARPR